MLGFTRITDAEHPRAHSGMNGSSRIKQNGVHARRFLAARDATSSVEVLLERRCWIDEVGGDSAALQRASAAACPGAGSRTTFTGGSFWLIVAVTCSSGHESTTWNFSGHT